MIHILLMVTGALILLGADVCFERTAVSHTFHSWKGFVVITCIAMAFLTAGYGMMSILFDWQAQGELVGPFTLLVVMLGTPIHMTLLTND